MSKINGKTIWLTGASSGIGLALAEALAEKGARLILTARSEATLNELAERLPGNHRVFSLDLSNPENAFQHGQDLVANETIDVLINNAGVSQRSAVLDTDLSVYRQLMEIDYFSVIALTKSVLAQMQARKQGHVVTIASVAGKVGSKLRSGYSGAKFGVIGFMDCARAEMAEHNVHFTTICPGFVRTQVSHNALTGDGSKLNQEDPDITGGISPEECAAAIIKAIEQDRDEVIVGKGLSKLAPTLQRFFPNLVRKLSAKR
ncbi:short chain dehydrogenase [Aliidiomarina iranensis]|uniref:Short chain dehydrogenase n=1 Tax=Aliidiomarina iranensis TaxID=1434071 RepID=A0A432W0T6_9GAMM|nr:SDR family oxidoreductase [Aliidiomarina iranensis]RUO22627.1 short chain dehydrogenase [Aliidiomarina iranensis]